jgi:hypothetical protein
MLSFSQFIKEDDDDYRSSFRPAIKGWMSPSGTPHLIGQYHEHKDNHHPEYLKHGGTQGDQVQNAQAKGFVRFGGNYSHVHGNHHFVHYDKKHPQGRETAIKALEYMKPHYDDPVTVSGSAGIYNREKGKRNATAMRQLGSSSVVSARQAMELLKKGKNTAPKRPHAVLEATEEQTLGRKIKAATTGSNDSYKILDSHPHTKGSTWQAGGCGVLAHALHKHMPGSKMVDVHNKKTGHTEHVAVQHGDHIYDADGATPTKHYLKKFGKREMKSHHDLELTDHNPARAAKSEISTHPSLINKTYKHLQKHLKVEAL